MVLTSTGYRRKLSTLLLAGMLSCIPVAAISGNILVLGLFKDMVIIKVDDMQYKLRVGEASPEGIKLISSNSDEAILQINGVPQTYTLGSHQSARSFQSDKKINEARIYANRGMYMTSGSINGLPVSFLIDTGASSVAMSTEHARQLGINYRYIGQKGAAGTASGYVRTWVFKLKSVRIGSIEVRNVDAAVVEGQGPSTILLGMSFLRHVRMQREGNLLQLLQEE